MKEFNDIKLYTCKEVAELIGASVTFVYDKVKQGEILSSRIGHTKYISEEALCNYLRGREPKRKEV